MITIKKTMLITLGLLLAPSVHAEKINTLNPLQLDTVSIGLTPNWADPGKTQTLFLLPDVKNTYVASKSTLDLFDAELFLGWQHALKSYGEVEYGLTYMVTNNARLHGVIWQTGYPEFDNESYAYHLNHQHVAIKGKFISSWARWVQPYVSASVGVGFNRSYDYSNTPLAEYVVASSNFASHVETSYAYTVGIGLQKKVTPSFAIGVGYQLVDWGESHLGPAPGQTQGQGLSLSHLYTNGVQISMSLSIDHDEHKSHQ